MAYKRDLSKPLAPTFGDDDKKKKKKKNGNVKIVKGRGNVVNIDTTGYSKGKQSFPYVWSRTNYGLTGLGSTKTKTGSASRKTADELLKRQNPKHKAKGPTGGWASKMLKRFRD
tara:strand:- start:331 stop:672 length:342 start_codon:yes stop_codon:yes gene_type:complete